MSNGRETRAAIVHVQCLETLLAAIRERPESPENNALADDCLGQLTDAKVELDRCITKGKHSVLRGAGP